MEKEFELNSLDLEMDNLEFVEASELAENDEQAIMGASCTTCVCTCSCCTT